MKIHNDNRKASDSLAFQHTTCELEVHFSVTYFFQLNWVPFHKI